MKTIKVHFNRNDFEELPCDKIYDAHEREDGFILFNNNWWWLVDKNDVSVIKST